MARLPLSFAFHRVLGSLSKFDPVQSTLIMQPESPGSGTWTGCPQFEERDLVREHGRRDESHKSTVPMLTPREFRRVR